MMSALLVVVSGSLIFTGCGKDLSKGNPLLPSNPTIIPCPTPRAFGAPYTQFEGSTFTPWGGSDIWTNTSQLSYSTRSNIGAYDACYSWWMQLNITPDATWGPWAGISGSESGNTDFGGKANFTMFYNIDKGTSFWILIDEGNTAGTSDGEEWKFQVNQCGTVLPTCLNANASWNELVIPISSFKESTNSATGNNVFDTDDIVQVWFNWSTNPMKPVKGANFYIDNVGFK